MAFKSMADKKKSAREKSDKAKPRRAATPGGEPSERAVSQRPDELTRKNQKEAFLQTEASSQRDQAEALQRGEGDLVHETSAAQRGEQDDVSRSADIIEGFDPKKMKKADAVKYRLLNSADNLGEEIDVKEEKDGSRTVMLTPEVARAFTDRHVCLEEVPE
jgi:hypothetical protein